MGEYSQVVIMREGEPVKVGMRTNNDPSEGIFATFTNILSLVAESIYPAQAALDKWVTAKTWYVAMQV